MARTSTTPPSVSAPPAAPRFLPGAHYHVRFVRAVRFGSLVVRAGAPVIVSGAVLADFAGDIRDAEPA